MFSAKKKLDDVKHPKTGGGPKLPDLTPAEEQIGTAMEGSPAMEGVPGGLESGASDTCVTFEIGTVALELMFKLLKYGQVHRNLNLLPRYLSSTVTYITSSDIFFNLVRSTVCA